MIVTDPAGGASLGPRFGYSSKFGRGHVSPNGVSRVHWDNVAKLAMLLALPLAGGYVVGATRVGALVSWVGRSALAAPFRPQTWAAYNVYQERGDLASLYRGEKQTLKTQWRIRPFSLGGGSLAGGVLPVPFPWFDLTPIRQKDVFEAEKAIEKITLPEVIQSPGNSSQVLPAGSVSPGGTPLGWIPVITTGRKRRSHKRSRVGF